MWEEGFVETVKATSRIDNTRMSNARLSTNQSMSSLGKRRTRRWWRQDIGISLVRSQNGNVEAKLTRSNVHNVTITLSIDSDFGLDFQVWKRPEPYSSRSSKNLFKLESGIQQWNTAVEGTYTLKSCQLDPISFGLVGKLLKIKNFNPFLFLSSQKVKKLTLKSAVDFHSVIKKKALVVLW